MITLVTRDQRRDVSKLMSQAGITPRITEVRPGDEELTRITGARTPSGVPVVITVPVVERPRRTASAPSRSRSRRRGAPGRQGQAQSGAAKGGAQTAQDRRRRPHPPHRRGGAPPQAAYEAVDGPRGLGPLVWITPASRGLARTSAALSSVADAPR